MARTPGYLKRGQEPYTVARFDYTDRLVAAQNGLSKEEADTLAARWSEKFEGTVKVFKKEDN